MRKAWPVIALYCVGFFTSIYYWAMKFDFSFEYVTLHELTGLAAFIGITAMTFQIVSAARWRLLEVYMGLDRLLFVHRYMGILAFVSILFHGAYRLALNFGPGFRPSMFEGMGITGLFLLTLISVSAIGYKKLKLPYEVWYVIHALTFVAYIFGFVHSITLSHTISLFPDFKTIWYVFAFFAAISAIKIILRKVTLYFNAYPVEAIEKDPSDVTQVHIKAADMNFIPGQFMFLGRKDNKHKWKPVIPHPFTITSHPEDDKLSFSIKAVGDFTSDLETLMPGDKVYLDGPYGVFTLAQYRITTDTPLLLIAGGIGITPFLAWLKGIPKDKLPNDIVLLWGNKTVKDALFVNEIEQLKESINLNTVYAFSSIGENDIPEGFPGETIPGRIDAQCIENNVDDLLKREVFICGPKEMMKSLRKTIKQKGVSGSKIHQERFGF